MQKSIVYIHHPFAICKSLHQHLLTFSNLSTPMNLSVGSPPLFNVMLRLPTTLFNLITDYICYWTLQQIENYVLLLFTNIASNMPWARKSSHRKW